MRQSSQSTLDRAGVPVCILGTTRTTASHLYTLPPGAPGVVALRHLELLDCPHALRLYPGIPCMIEADVDFASSSIHLLLLYCRTERHERL